MSPLARRFAVFMPPWSIVRAELAGCAASTEAIDAAYSRPVTLERLAAQLGLSASFMAAHSSRLTG